MKNIILKLSLILLVILLISSIGISTIYANPVNGFKPVSTDASNSVNNVSGNVLGVIQITGTVIAIVMLIYLGIRYAIAAPEEKANIKKTSVIYVVGAIILFAAVNIAKFIYDFTQQAI